MRITLPESAAWPVGDEMSAAEFQSLLASQGQTDFTIPPAEAVAPDWQTNEKAFTQKVIDFAREHGWELRYHTFNSASSAPGFPDLVLGRRGVVERVAELKVCGKQPTKDQRQWLEAFAAAGIPADVWTPEIWESICEVLR